MNTSFKLMSLVLLAAVGTAPNSGLHGARGGSPDEALTEQVQRQFRTHVLLREPEISVTTSGGVVTLEGTVASLVVKHRAEELSRQLPGVEAVVNELKVATPSDAAENVARVIERKFREDSLLRERKLHAASAQGIVTLSGDVRSPYEKSHAERLVRQSPGVLLVRNQIRLQTVSDENLRSAVWDELDRDERFESLLVDVRVEDQVVTLHGYVESPQQRDLAESRTATIPGVLGVDNRLIVAHWPGPTYR